MVSGSVIMLDNDFIEVTGFRKHFHIPTSWSKDPAFVQLYGSPMV